MQSLTEREFGLNANACGGIPEGQHASLQSVTEEADKAMYERKQFVKETFMSEEAQPDSDAASEEISVINTRKHILIADDMESNREILGDLL